MRHSDIQHRLIFLLKMLGVAALYALFAHISHLYIMSNDNSISAIWPSSGLALAALLIGGKRYAWSVFIGSLLMANVMDAGASVWTDIAIALGNTLAALLGAWLLTRNGRLGLAIGSLRDFLLLILLGGCIAGITSALIGNTALLASGFINSGEYLDNLLRWWMGDVLGVILITPLILSWQKTKITHAAPTVWVFEPILLVGLTFILGQVVFLDWFHVSVGLVAKGYWMFLLIIWVAVRLGVRSVTLALFVTAGQALWGAYRGIGYFANDIAETQLVNYWLYMVTLSVVGMALATYFAERKQIMDALNQFKYTLDQTLDSIFMFREDNFRFIYVNEGAIKHVGYTADELLGMTPLDIKPEFTLARFQEIVQPLRDGTQPSLTFETVHRHKDVHDIPVEIFLQLVRNEGAESRYMAIVRDITERKQSEAKIERLSRAYRLLSRVNEAIVRAQDRDELFTAICSAAVESELFRFVWIGMLDEQKLSVIPVAYAGVEEGYTDKLNIRLDDEHTGNGTTGSAVREGTHVVCQDIEHDPSMAPWRDEALKRGYHAVGSFPIREAGCVVGSIGVYTLETQFFTPDIVKLMLEFAVDISFALDVLADKKRRQQAEDEIKQLNVELEHRVLERTRQLEDANNELETFSYSVSHDLRAPLRSIDGFSQILLKTYHDQLDATGEDYLQRVRRASQRMGHLIDDLLQLSQVTRGSLKRDSIDLSAIAEQVADDLRKTNPGRQVRFSLQQGLFVQADSGLLRIVIENLFGNAYKFTGRTLGAEIEFGKRDIDGEGVFFVRDNGDGFNMDYVHKLFGAFQRLHGVDEFEGTGIGLATVQRIIQRHNGKVWAEGKEGQGATFYFTLPQRERKT